MSRNQQHELSGRLLPIILIRALVLLVWLNLAGPLGLLPERQGSLPFLPVFDLTAVTLTVIFLLLWRFGHNHRFQFFLQAGADLALTTILVGYSGGIESTFVSFYLLIIIYCSLALGPRGGIVGAALSTIVYAGIITASGLGLIGLDGHTTNPLQATFRIAAHALGFWSVALLANYLHQRLRTVEGELKEQIDSFTQLQRVNEHIISSIRSGLITTDLSGCVTVFNAAAEELTGQESASMLSRPIQSLIGSTFWNRIRQPELLGTARPLRHEQWVDLPRGAKRFLGFSVSPLLDQHQQLLGYIISFQDLTEIIRLEEEVRLKERMAVLGRMAAGIAHEIRNPLTSIRGSVEILSSRNALSDKDRKLLDILIRESDRLNKFVEDFLNYARPRKYEKRPLDAVQVLKDSVTLLRNSPEFRDKYSASLDLADDSVMILGSADQLNQVFWNLAQNAVRAMPEGGEIRISVGKTREGTGRIVFQDNGIGMSSAEQANLFQPLHPGFQKGLGLGLSIIFQIMEDHGGKIAFDSEKGKGTKVILSFPLQSTLPLENVEHALAG